MRICIFEAIFYAIYILEYMYDTAMCVCVCACMFVSVHAYYTYVC